MANSYYAPGENNVICDRCGMRFKSSQVKRTWDGLYVCEKDWETRHPQDFVRSVKDDQTVKINKPRVEPVFTDEAASLPLPPNPLGV
jgi:hypothetical protein